MSDTENAKAGNGKWTDRQRLAYYFNLVEHSNVKLDFKNAPRPDGKSVGACQIMVHRLKGTLKDELEALKSGQPMPDEGTPKKTPTSTPRKRKPKGDAADATPTKRGRKKKSEAEVPDAADDEEVLGVKAEPVDEALDIETEI